jgi:hypothetical protein
MTPAEMPYQRDGACELCGAEGKALKRVVLQPSSGSYGSSFKCARVVYACPDHDGAGGPVLKAPNRGMAPGTSVKKPQKETLW